MKKEKYDIEKMMDCAMNLKELIFKLSEYRYTSNKSVMNSEKMVERTVAGEKCILPIDASSDRKYKSTACEMVSVWMQTSILMSDRGEYYFRKWRLDKIASWLFLGREREDELCDDIELLYRNGNADNENSLFLSTLAVIAVVGAAMYDCVGRENMDASFLCRMFGIPVKEAKNVMEFIELYCGYRHIFMVPQLLGIFDEAVDTMDEFGGKLRTELAAHVLVEDDGKEWIRRTW